MGKSYCLTVLEGASIPFPSELPAAMGIPRLVALSPISKLAVSSNPPLALALAPALAPAPAPFTHQGL